MNRLKRPILWAALIAIIVLAGLSVYGAFIGATRAQAFFNSIPVGFYWGTLILLLAAGFVIFRSLARVPSLLLMHLGCILILVGGIWGSATGQEMQRKLLDRKIIPKGQTPIVERSSERRVWVDDSNDTYELPFEIRAKDVRVEYYRVGTLQIQSQTGQTWRLATDPEAKLNLGESLGSIRVLKIFQNFKIDISGDEPVEYDAPGGSNPAVVIMHDKPDGSSTRHRVFASQAGHGNQGPLRFAYWQSIRDYISELEVVKDGQVVAAKDIEVNHPLHYGGYHFYQNQYGSNQMGEYTVLSVVPDTGLNTVYAGFAMLIAGVFWHFWGRRALRAMAKPQPYPVKTEPHGN